MRNIIKFLTFLVSLSKIQDLFCLPRKTVVLQREYTAPEAMALAEAGDGKHAMGNRRSRTLVFNSNLHVHCLWLMTKLYLGFHSLSPDSNLVNHFF